MRHKHLFKDHIAIKVATIGATIAVGLLMVPGAASAAPMCDTSIAGNVAPSLACQVGSTNNDKLNPSLQVNIDDMFGPVDWSFLARDNDLDGTDEGPTPAALSLTGGQVSGNWAINEPTFSAFNQFMLVLKGAVGNNTQGTYAGWLVTEDMGTYTTPFFNVDPDETEGNPKQISHISLYARNVSVPPNPVPNVPLPAAAWLLLSGAGALGAVRMKKRKS